MSLIILLILVIVLYFGGRALGFRLGGNPNVWLGVTLVTLAVNVLMMFRPEVLGLFGNLVGLAFPFALGTYRGSKNRALKDQSGSGGA